MVKCISYHCCNLNWVNKLKCENLTDGFTKSNNNLILRRRKYISILSQICIWSWNLCILLVLSVAVPFLYILAMQQWGPSHQYLQNNQQPIRLTRPIIITLHWPTGLHYYTKGITLHVVNSAEPFTPFIETVLVAKLKSWGFLNQYCWNLCLAYSM